MAEQTIPNSGNPRVDAALARIRGKFADLEDAMIVQAHLEKDMAAHLKKHARAIEEHDEWQHKHDKLHDRLAQEAAERGRCWMSESRTLFRRWANSFRGCPHVSGSAK